eukprot:scaffold602_cov227-Chaetoceros_neogracile.AAC.9
MIRFASSTIVKRLGTGMATGSILYGSNNFSSTGMHTRFHTAEAEAEASHHKISQIATTNKNNIIVPQESSESIIPEIKPLVEASVRGLRLVQTVFMIVLEYKLEECKEPCDRTLHAWGIESHLVNHELSALEKTVQRTTSELQEAQILYGTKEKEGTIPLVIDVEEKESRRKGVLAAAERLGRAERELSQLVAAIESTVGDEDMSVHARAARRIRNLCRINGGTYIKIGQHLANLDHLLPPAYIKTLHSLFGDAPMTDYSDVREVVREELGQYPEDIFIDFQTEPIASASLAQVHIAKDGQGNKLAIKVQHRGLRETSKGDILALETMVRFVDRVFDDFRWGWICDEIAPNLPKELDFSNEGKNAEAAARHISKTGLPCIVPKVHWDQTTSRVLVMDFEEGYSSTDIQNIEASNVNKKDLALLISSVFQAQIFQSGFIHCDPHPANVFWRSKNGKPELILFDHGLYKQIDDEFRMTYAKLWKSLLMADIEGIKSSCLSLGVKEMYPLLSSMLTSRPFDEVVERNKTRSFTAKDSIDVTSDAAMIRGYAQQYLKEIIQMLDKVPPQMLLLFKMNDCLRHIDHVLGSPANTMVVAGKYAAETIYAHEKKFTKSFSQRIRNWMSHFVFMTRIKVYELATSNWLLSRKTIVM